jgi:crossover junction endodeoxyribonuclease RusA
MPKDCTCLPGSTLLCPRCAALAQRAGIVLERPRLAELASTHRTAAPWRAVVLTIPYPMSVNNYWCHVGLKRLLTSAARDFRQRIAAVVEAQWREEWPRPLDGRLALTLTLYPPDQRLRDLDNVCKPLLDALEHARVYANDGQIDALHVFRQHVTVPSKAEVSIEPWQPG